MGLSLRRKSPSPTPDRPMIRVRCPICDRVMQAQNSTEWPEFPFCSPRCKVIDLGRWLGGDYRIPPETEGEAQPGDEQEVP